MRIPFKHLFFISLCISVGTVAAQDPPDFRNSRLPVQQRVNDLLTRLTTEEKISLLGYRSKPVERLGIPAYNWWNEALHGVARAGEATVFPQAIGMAASFNEALLYDVSTAISTEARAKYNLAVSAGRHSQYQGLTFWSPNINIFRDPRWGRGQETYGEDPFLTSRLGLAFVKGMQGTDPARLKTSACAKHFAVHSGPEAGRHSFNAVIDEVDLRETYLPAFKTLVDGGVESIMCAYNRVNGEPCCTGNTLLQSILRKEWKFKGHVVTDCWALEDIWKQHRVMQNSTEVAAAAIRAGVNLDCSNMLQDDVLKALQLGLLKIQEIDSALAGILRTQVKLGFFDDGGLKEYATFGNDSISNDWHQSLARQMARESMVLLKNDKQILPLHKEKLESIMVIGPNAASLDALLGNYHGVSGKAVNYVEGIVDAAGANTRVEYDMGCDFSDTLHFGGLWSAGNSDVTIAIVGLTPVYEGEEGDAFLSPGGGDKKDLSLPASQVAFLKALRKSTAKPVVVVITGGSALDIASIEPYADAIIFAWYAGEQGGNALADLLFGKYSPSGKLPVTFYKSTKDLPAFENYAMAGRTYRYFDGEVNYPFGFGLSYTSFVYKWSQAPTLKGDSITFAVSVTNTGNSDGKEVLQAYIRYPSGHRLPVKELKAFSKVHIIKGKSAVVRFTIPLAELQKWDPVKKTWMFYPGEYSVFTGSHSSDEKLSAKILLKSRKKFFISSP